MSFYFQEHINWGEIPLATVSQQLTHLGLSLSDRRRYALNKKCDAVGKKQESDVGISSAPVQAGLTNAIRASFGGVSTR